MKNHPNTPFPVTGYHGPKYFCDRENEISRLHKFIEGGIPTMVLGVRRLGKTGLLQHMIHQMDEPGVLVDLDGTSSLNDLIAKLAEGINMAFPEKKYVTLWKSLRTFRPVISFDPLTGTPQFSFNVQNREEAKRTLHGILELLSSRKESVVIIFDEFQEIARYEAAHTEGLIRAEMQQSPHLRFVFSGSRQRLLAKMLQEGSRPFFSNVSKIYLEKLPREIYADFIQKQFQENGKAISLAIVSDLVDWTEIHTYYTQFVFNQLFLVNKRKVSEDELGYLKWQILQTARQDFLQMKNLLSEGQLRLLIAIGKEVDMYQPFSQSHILKYGLSTPAGVKKALNVLIDKQLVNEFYDEQDEKYYKMADVFMMRYIQAYK
ncbi:MAG TPA: ATP-binding protein [Cyclobacteriaceae bacterium]